KKAQSSKFKAQGRLQVPNTTLLRKHQTPSSKHQINPKIQLPNPSGPCWSLVARASRPCVGCPRSHGRDAGVSPADRSATHPLMSPEQQSTAASVKSEWFTSTHLSVVLMAGQTSSPQAAEALEKLCRSYWYPLYAYVRRKGHPPHDAQDLTQEFFARLLASNYLETVGREKGKFRSFLLAALNHFLADERDRALAAKRGGGKVFLSLDEQD